MPELPRTELANMWEDDWGKHLSLGRNSRLCGIVLIQFHLSFLTLQLPRKLTVHSKEEDSSLEAPPTLGPK